MDLIDLTIRGNLMYAEGVLIWGTTSESGAELPSLQPQSRLRYPCNLSAPYMAPKHQAGVESQPRFTSSLWDQPRSLCPVHHGAISSPLPAMVLFYLNIEPPWHSMSPSIATYLKQLLFKA